MIKMIVGRTYKIKDSRKGNFTMKVTAINGDFADGIIIEGTARYLTREDGTLGDAVGIRKGLCTFTLVD